MSNGWIMEELKTADLRDKRLEKRLIKLLDTLSQNSTRAAQCLASLGNRDRN